MKSRGIERSHSRRQTSFAPSPARKLPRSRKALRVHDSRIHVSTRTCHASRDIGVWVCRSSARNQVLFGIVGQPDAGSQHRTVFQRYQRVLDNAHGARKSRQNLRGPQLARLRPLRRVTVVRSSRDELLAAIDVVRRARKGLTAVVAMASSFGCTDNRTRRFLRFEGRSLVASHRKAPYRRFQEGDDGGPLESKRTSGSTFLIMSPSQTAARVDIFMIAALPQTGQRHRNANGEAAAGSQSQCVSAWFIRDTLNGFCSFHLLLCGRPQRDSGLGREEQKCQRLLEVEANHAVGVARITD